MKNKLAVFDLDKTLKKPLDSPEAHKVLYADGKLPEFWNGIVDEWEALRWHKIQVLNERKLNKIELWNILEELSGKNEALIEGMDKVVEHLYRVSYIHGYSWFEQHK